MKYDDDELAEAALLLAYHESHDQPGAPSMPRALEQKLLEQGRAHASEVRYSTTKAAAVAVDPVAPAGPSKVSRIGGWTGWLAAAACFAFAVYEWRLSSLQTTVPVTARATPWLEARDATGREVAELGAGGEPEITVTSLPANVAGEHYRIWISTSAARSPAAAGSFVCTEACRQRVLTGALPKTGIQGLWITRNRTIDPWTSPDEKMTIAEGHHGTL